MSAPRHRRLVLVTGVVLLVSGVLLGVLALPTRSVVEDRDAARALRTLLSRDGVAADAALPSGFASTMGYRPVLRHGVLVRPDGSCSSPVPLPHRFTSVCARHDLGYDLLRYAAARGRPLGPWARERLDASLAGGLRAACPRSVGGCRIAAEAATVAVRANSLRQGNRTPVPETAVSVGALALGGGGLLTALVLPFPALAATRPPSRLAKVTRHLGRRLPAPPLLLVPGLAATAALVPAVLARPAWLQGVWTGLLVGATYPVAHALARGQRRRPARPRARVVALVLGLVAPVTVAAGQALAGAPVLDPARSPGPASGWLLVVLVALPVAGVTALLGRLGAGLLRRVAALPAGRPRLYAGALAAVAVLPFSADPVGATARAALTSDLGARAFALIGLDTAADNVLNRPSRRGAVRVYVGVDEETGPGRRSRLAVRRLAERDAFERGNLVIALPTGSGWVDPIGVRALERRFRGDVATVAVQSTYLPSWAALMVARRDNEEGARTLVAAVADRLAALPASERPRLYLLGQSLGVLAATAVPADSAGAELLCGATWTGPPGGEVPDLPGSVVIANADDPVVSWEPALAWRRPASYPGAVWVPGLSWLATGVDTIGALGTPAGHGHRYGPDQGRLLPECPRHGVAGSPVSPQFDMAARPLTR